MKRQKLFKGITAGVLALGLVACGSSDGDGGGQPATGDGDDGQEVARIVSMAGITTNTTIDLGIENGNFSDNGLDASLIEVENPPAALAAMQGGNAEFAYAPLSTALTAASEDIDIRIVAAAEGFPEDGEGAEQYDDTAIVVNPSAGITDPGALAGQVVAVPSRSGMMEIVIANAIAEGGGDISTIEWQALDQQSQLTALAQDRIQGAGLATPFTDQAIADGMEVISRPKAQFFKQGAAGVWITTTQIAEEQPDLVEKFQTAVNTANGWANDHLVDIAEIQIADRDLNMEPEDMIVGYFPTTLSTKDVQRAGEQMVALGFLEEEIDAASIVIEDK